MKTSAHPSPQIDQAAPLLPEQVSSFTGVLIAHSQVRAKACDQEGHMVPVLVMDIELECPRRNRMRVEQPFPVNLQAACEAAAHRYRKGTRITVEVPVESLRVVASNARHIHVHQPEEPAA